MPNLPSVAFRRPNLIESFLLRAWRNSVVVQGMDESYRKVPMLRHLVWAFGTERRMLSFIVSDCLGDIGYVRFTKRNDAGHLFWSFAKNPSRSGVGRILMSQGVEICQSVLGAGCVFAKIHKSNCGSVRLHKELGFEEVSTFSAASDEFLFMSLSLSR